jgi:hypothetical protein
VIYSTAETKVYAKIGFYKIRIIPSKPEKMKKKPQLKRKKAVKEKAEKPQEEAREEKQKIKLGKWLAFGKDMSALLLKKLRKYLKIKIYRLNIKAGAKDAYKTALLYGNITQAVYYVYEILADNFTLNAKNINVQADFFSEKINFDIDIKAQIKLRGILSLLISGLFGFVKFQSENKINNTANQTEKRRVEING